MFLNVVLFILPVLSLSILKSTSLQRHNATALSQPGPEKIECFHAGGSNIDWNSCQSTFHLLDNDILQHPGPQLWGGRQGRYEAVWGSLASTCYFIVYPDTDEPWNIPQQNFSFALVKRLALGIVNLCSLEAEGYGIGGEVEIAPKFTLEVSGVEEIFSKDLKVAKNGSITDTVHRSYSID